MNVKKMSYEFLEFIERIYIFRYRRVPCIGTVERSLVRNGLLTTSRKAVNWIIKMVRIIFKIINILIYLFVQLLLLIIIKFSKLYAYANALNWIRLG